MSDIIPGLETGTKYAHNKGNIRVNEIIHFHQITCLMLSSGEVEIQTFEVPKVRIFHRNSQPVNISISISVKLEH